MSRPARRAHPLRRVRPGSCLRTPFALALAFLVQVALATPALAQHAGTPGSAPPLPSGDGRLTVQVIDPSGSARVAGLSLALYALAPDGTPGLGNGETGGDGSFSFEGISTDPQIVYLVGARYSEIPFGERFTFEPGQSEGRVEIEISAPSERLEGVRLEELRARVDWLGDRIVVRELLRIRNPGPRVILLPAQTKQDRAIFLRPLASGARDFSAGPTAIGEGLALEEGAVRFRGPLYPGEQQVEYSYSLPADPGTQRFELPVTLRESVGRVVVVAGTPGLEARGPGLVASQEVVSEGGQSLASWVREGLGAGARLDLALDLPELRSDPELLTIPRADVWLELDDTRLSATRVELQLEVAPGAPLAGTHGEPLLRIALPRDARLGGVAPEAEPLGLVPRNDGGFDVIGPIGPGTTSLGFSYHLPAGPEGARLNFEFPRKVATLNVLIADTGLAIESRRLHRRRPFRSGTRNYLHREAFNVDRDEAVDLSLEPLRGAGLPRSASLSLTVAAVAAAALFLSAPLRSRAARGAAREGDSAEASPVRAEREALYTTIADLDHDFETGKLEQSDYHEMRDTLRRRAIELLRLEREGAAAAASSEGAAVGQPQAAPAERSVAASSGPRIGRFCPACGAELAARWRFCSQCGEALDRPADEEPG